MKILSNSIDYNLTNKEIAEKYLGRKVECFQLDTKRYFTGIICGYHNDYRNRRFNDVNGVLIGIENNMIFGVDYNRIKEKSTIFKKSPYYYFFEEIKLI